MKYQTTSLYSRVVIKSRGPGILPRLLLLENGRKIEPKEIPSHLIPRLLVVFTRQLEILVTTLLQSGQVKRTFQDFINEFVIQKLNLLVVAVMSMKFKSTIR